MDNSGYIQSSYNPIQEDIIKYLESLGAKVRFEAVDNSILPSSSSIKDVKNTCIVLDYGYPSSLNEQGINNNYLAFSCEFYNGIYYYMSTFCSSLKNHLKDYLDSSDNVHGNYASKFLCAELKFTKDLTLSYVSLFSPIQEIFVNSRFDYYHIKIDPNKSTNEITHHLTCSVYSPIYSAVSYEIILDRDLNFLDIDIKDKIFNQQATNMTKETKLKWAKVFLAAINNKEFHENIAFKIDGQFNYEDGHYSLLEIMRLK